jgi:hypothetical protein
MRFGHLEAKVRSSRSQVRGRSRAIDQPVIPQSCTRDSIHTSWLSIPLIYCQEPGTKIPLRRVRPMPLPGQERPAGLSLGRRDRRKGLPDKEFRRRFWAELRRLQPCDHERRVAVHGISRIDSQQANFGLGKEDVIADVAGCRTSGVRPSFTTNRRARSVKGSVESQQFCPTQLDVAGFDFNPLQDNLLEVVACRADSLGHLPDALATWLRKAPSPANPPLRESPAAIRQPPLVAAKCSTLRSGPALQCRA